MTLLLAVALAIADPPSRVRTTLDPKGDVWVGQRVTLVVELLAPGPFASAPAFDLPEVPGVLILKPEDRAVVGSEEVGGVTYTTQRHEFAVFPERAGAVNIPPFAVRFESSAGYGKPATPQRVTTAPVAFTAKLPPGAERLRTVVTTGRLTLAEKWTPEPGPAAVGAAFTRTVTVEVKDVPGMALPALRAEPPTGLRAYPKPPVVEDRVGRGELTGRRVETVTYVCERPGAYTLPALALAWWDPDGRSLTRSRLPARSFVVTAPPTPAAPAAEPPPEPRRLWPWGVAVIAVAVAVWRFGPRLMAGWRRCGESEPASFRAFRRACRAGDAAAARRALVAWLDRAGGPDPVPTLGTFAARAADPALTSALTTLGAAAFGRPDVPRPDPSLSELARLVAAARRRLSRAGAAGNRSALPPLNPTESPA